MMEYEDAKKAAIRAYARGVSRAKHSQGFEDLSSHDQVMRVAEHLQQEVDEMSTENKILTGIEDVNDLVRAVGPFTEEFKEEYGNEEAFSLLTMPGFELPQTDN